MHSHTTTGFHARASDMSEPSINDESAENAQVSKSSATNDTTFQDVMNEESFTNFDDITNHTNVANETLYKVKCEKNYLRKQRCKMVLLSMCIGIIKGCEAFNYENDDVCSKCPLIEMRKLCLPKNKDLHDEVARRNYCASRTLKKCKSWNMTRCKEWLSTNLVADVNDVRFLLREEAIFYNTTKQSNDDSKSTQHLKSKK